MVELPPFHGGDYCGFETHTGHHASVAQLVEQRSEEPRAAGSTPAGSTIEGQTLVSGVADLQVQFGIDADGIKDTNGNVTIDRYVNANSIAAADWPNVYAAKIWLLMRSDKPQIGVDTTKSFTIAGAPAQTFGGQDDFRYFLVTSVVNLRNLKQI